MCRITLLLRTQLGQAPLRFFHALGIRFAAHIRIIRVVDRFVLMIGLRLCAETRGVMPYTMGAAGETSGNVGEIVARARSNWVGVAEIARLACPQIWSLFMPRDLAWMLTCRQKRRDGAQHGRHH